MARERSTGSRASAPRPSRRREPGAGGETSGRGAGAPFRPRAAASSSSESPRGSSRRPAPGRASSGRSEPERRTSRPGAEGFRPRPARPTGPRYDELSDDDYVPREARPPRSVSRPPVAPMSRPPQQPLEPSGGGEGASRDEYVYGINTVQELVSHYPGEVRELLLARDKRDPRVASLLEQAEAAGILIHVRPTTVLSKLAGNDHHQGLVAVVEGFRYTELETLQELLKTTARPLVVFLDGIQDPGNLGAVLRSAYLLGATGVVIPRDRACGVTPAARKASAGAAMHLPVVQATNVIRAMELLFEEQGLWMLGLDQGAPQTLDQLDLTVPLGLVIGGEEKGVRPIVRKACQLMGRIPQLAHSSGVDSLNASVAGAIALYEIQRQRLVKKG